MIRRGDESVGRDLISKVTDAVMEDARAWQARPLDDVYPVVVLDALVLKIRDGGSVQRRACYLALAITMDGERQVLGMWFQANEGAKFWMQVLTDLKQRGVRDILICCVDGLKGFPEAIEAVFPLTTVQTCIVHLIRQSLRYVPRRQYDAVVKDLKPIYTAIDSDTALVALESFEEVGLAVVVGLPDPDRGEVVAAALAPKPGAVVDAEDLLQRLDKEISSYKLPRRVMVLGEGDVPYLPSGKPDRLRIGQLLQTSSVEYRPRSR